jgi:hypothetical protein
MARIEAGERLAEPDQTRFVLLKAAIDAARQRGRLICVEGEQDDEVRVGHGDVERVRGCIARTTWTARLRHRFEVENLQFFRMAQAFLRGDTHVRFPFRDAFESDPVKDAATKRPFLITCHFNLSPEEQQQRLDTRRQLRDQWEANRKANRTAGVTFEQRRDREYLFLADVGRELLREAAAKAAAGDQLGVAQASLNLASSPTNRQYNSWVGAGGAPEKFWDFVGADHYRAIPVVDLYANLIADILTGKGAVDDGDSMDFNHVASALPYCHFALMDRKMCNRVSRLGLDAKYGVRVFSMVDVDVLAAQLGRPP